MVSVVIATYGRSTWLPALHDTLGGLEEPAGGFEVVVVDDASDDDTWKILCHLAARSPLRFQGVRLAVNVGQGAARTVGVEHARGAIVAFTDDDCLPRPTWLTALSAPLLETAALQHPRVVQGRTEPWPGDAGRVGPWARTIWVLHPTWLFETCNIAYRRCDLLAVGGFAGRGEAPVGAHGRLAGEDVLTGWAVMERGATLVFVPRALVHHRHHPASYWQFVGEQRGRAVFPVLVGRDVSVRTAMWHRWFLARRTALFDAAILAAALGSSGSSQARRCWWLGVVPWAWAAASEARHRPGRPVALRLAQLALADAVGGAALVAGSFRAGHLVI